PPDHQNHLGLWMERSHALVQAGRPERLFSVLSVLSVRKNRGVVTCDIRGPASSPRDPAAAIRPFPRDRRSRSAFRRRNSERADPSTSLGMTPTPLLPHPHPAAESSTRSPPTATRPP